MRGICKYFPGVRALHKVDFTLCEGEIHALMGENGAGKSTLIKVLTGVYEKDEGEIYLKGLDKPAVIHSPQDAQNLGISTVYQEITLCPNLTVAETRPLTDGALAPDPARSSDPESQTWRPRDMLAESVVVHERPSTSTRSEEM